MRRLIAQLIWISWFLLIGIDSPDSVSAFSPELLQPSDCWSPYPSLQWDMRGDALISKVLSSGNCAILMNEYLHESAVVCPDYVPKTDSNLYAFQNVTKYVTKDWWLTVDEFKKLNKKQQFRLLYCSLFSVEKLEVNIERVCDCDNEQTGRQSRALIPGDYFCECCQSGFAPDKLANHLNARTNPIHFINAQTLMEQNLERDPSATPPNPTDPMCYIKRVPDEEAERLLLNKKENENVALTNGKKLVVVQKKRKRPVDEDSVDARPSKLPSVSLNLIILLDRVSILLLRIF